MSVEAISWALKQEVPNSSTKFVLVVLSNCASGDTFIAWPSVAYMTKATSQNRKTIIANLARLIEMGFIEDTGKRAGGTKSIPVYSILCNTENGTSTENGTAKAVPKTDGSSPENGRKQSRKRDTETKETKGTVNKSLGKEPNRGTRLPENWECPQEVIEFARDKLNLADEVINFELGQFRDHWKSMSGAKGVHLDWAATCRNWFRNYVKWRTGKNGNAQKTSKSASERVAEVNRNAERNANRTIG